MTRTCWLTEVTFFSSSVALNWTEDVFRGSRERLELIEETKSYLIELPHSVVGKNHRGRLCQKDWNRGLRRALAGMEHRPSWIAAFWQQLKPREQRRDSGYLSLVTFTVWAALFLGWMRDVAPCCAFRGRKRGFRRKLCRSLSIWSFSWSSIQSSLLCSSFNVGLGLVCLTWIIDVTKNKRTFYARFHFLYLLITMCFD